MGWLLTLPIGIIKVYSIVGLGCLWQESPFAQISQELNFRTVIIGNLCDELGIVEHIAVYSRDARQRTIIIKQTRYQAFVESILITLEEKVLH